MYCLRNKKEYEKKIYLYCKILVFDRIYIGSDFLKFINLCL